MTVTFKCNECKQEAPGDLGIDDYVKPSEWFCRPYIDVFQHACSKECVDKLLEKFPLTPEEILAGKNQDG